MEESEIVEKVAKVCHEANRAYCETIGDDSQPTWEDAPKWQRKSASEGAAQWLAGAITSPKQSHMSWMKQKLDDGWVYGAEKDAEAKTHPCLMSYEVLPLEQRRKDAIFAGICRAFC